MQPQTGQNHTSKRGATLGTEPNEAGISSPRRVVWRETQYFWIGLPPRIGYSVPFYVGNNLLICLVSNEQLFRQSESPAWFSHTDESGVAASA